MDRSLKLLNYATLDGNNNLVLYTELNHTFQEDDVIYITGGYYDNVNNLQYNNPFTNTQYKIIAINNSLNSFTLDFFISNINDLVYPYGTDDNRFGNPLDNVNLAYNSFLMGMNKAVYVSKTIINAGYINNTNINNGVFGSDNNIITINESNITHICGKNISVKNVEINDKLSNTPPATTKYRVNEDLTINPQNPFNLVSVPIGINNGGYSYSVFERINNLNDNVIINSGNYTNNEPGFIDIEYNSGTHIISNSKIGNNNNLTNITNASFGGEITFENCEINGISNTTLDEFTFNDCTINTKVEVNADVFDINIIDIGYITLSVNYDFIANNVFSLGTNVVLTNVKYNNEKYHYLNKNIVCDIEDVEYVFGDITSAKITLFLQNLYVNNNWADIFNNINDYDFSDICFYSNINPTNIHMYNNCKIQSSLISININIFESNIISGRLNNVKLGNNNIIGNILSELNLINVYLLLYQNSNNNNNIIGAYIDTNTPIIGTIDNCTIDKAHISDSDITNCIINNVSSIALNTLSKTIIYNSRLKENNIVSPSVFCNNTIYGEYGEFIDKNILFSNSTYPEDRKSPWITGKISQQLPRPRFDSHTENINCIKNNENYYNYYDRLFIKNLSSLQNVSIQTPNVSYLSNVINNINDEWFLISNNVRYNDNIPAWEPTSNATNILIYGGLLNSKLEQSLINRVNYNTIGVTNPLTGVSLPPNNLIDIIEVDDNFIYDLTLNIYNNNNSFNNTFENYFVFINAIDETPNEFPDYNQNVSNLDNLITCTVTNVSNTYNINNNDILSITSGNYNIEFNIDYSGFVDKLGNTMQKICATFIEIEQVYLESQETYNKEIYYPNYIPTYSTVGISPTTQPYNSNTNNNYAYNNILLLGELNTVPHNNFLLLQDNPILNDSTSPIQLKLLSDSIKITITYWITWYYDESGLLSISPEPNPFYINEKIIGHRTKHTFEFTVRD